MPRFIYIIFYHRANNRGQYADEFHNSRIDDKDGHIPSQAIIFICTAFRHAPLEWQKNKGVHPKIPNQWWKQTDLITRTTSTARMTVVRSYPVALWRVASCQPRLVLRTRTQSWWIPGTFHRRASSRRWITTLVSSSGIRSNRRRSQRLPWWSAWKQCLLTMLYFLTIRPLKRRMRNLSMKHWPKHPDRWQLPG